MDVNGDVPVEQDDAAGDLSAEPVDDVIPAAVWDVIHQLTEDRKELEQFMEQNCLRLTQMREQVRTEAAIAEKNWRQQLETLQAERDAAHQQMNQLREELRTSQLAGTLAAEELAQARLQSEHHRRHGAELQRLLDAMGEEAARREKEQRAELDRLRQVETDHTELLDMMQGFEQMEAEVRQQQETVRKEREALMQERLRGGPPAQPVSRLAPVPGGPGEPRLLAFACKHCGAQLQAKERLAGLVTRCGHCSKMAPVPRQ